jgi:hypothetical protein
MASTTFIDNQTTIFADWLNDANNAVYNGIFVSPTITATSMVCTGTASGAGFTNLINNVFSSPGAIGSATPNTGAFTTLSSTSSTTTTLTTSTINSPLSLRGTTSGTVSLAIPAVAGTNTMTFPSGSGTVTVNGLNSNIVSGAIIPTVTGTGFNFSSIPSWVKRITVMFNGVSTNGSSKIQVQLGVGGTPETSNYNTITGFISTPNNTSRAATNATGFALNFGGNEPTGAFYGDITFSLLGSNIWTGTGSVYDVGNSGIELVAGSKALAGTLDMIRITTVNGTDTFDAGSINILYE